MNTLLTADFDQTTLTKGLNAAPVSLGPVSKSGLFDPRSATTVDVAIEQINESLSLIQSSMRGGVVMPHPHTSRSMVKFKAPHLRTSSTLLADSWQGRTGFGQNAAPASVLTERDRVLMEHRRRLEATIDYHMTRALGGQIVDADGSVMVDLLAEFGVSQITVEMALATTTTNIANKIIAARRQSEAELGTAYAASWVAFCDATFIDAVRAHPSIEAGLANWQAATALLSDHRSGDLVVGGVRLVEVPNRAGKTYIPAGTAFLCPEGVPDLFVTHFAPADYVETVNTEGLPLYAKAELLDFNRGVSIESQSNPISICSRPRTVIHLNA